MGRAPLGRGGRWEMEKPLTGTHVSGDMLGPGKGGLAYWTLGEGVSSLWTTAARGAGDGTDLVVASHGVEEMVWERVGVGGRKLRAGCVLGPMIPYSILACHTLITRATLTSSFPAQSSL